MTNSAVTEAGLAVLAASCRHLAPGNVLLHERGKAARIWEAVSGWRRLPLSERKIDLSAFPAVTDAGLQMLLKVCGLHPDNVKSRVKGTKFWSEAYRTCPELPELDLTSSPYVTDEGLAALARVWSKLHPNQIHSFSKGGTPKASPNTHKQISFINPSSHPSKRTSCVCMCVRW